MYVFLAVLGLCCCEGFSLVAVRGFSLKQLLLCRAQTLRHMDLVVVAPGSGAQAQYLWHTGLVDPWHVGSSWIRDGTCVSCIGRWILYH